ncbi:tetratricopeptide repeat protein [Rhodoglobus aureus]
MYESLSDSELTDLGCDAADRGDHDTAILIFTAAIERGEEWAGINLGNSLMTLADVPRAVSAFEHAWRVGKDPDAGFNLAWALDESERVEESREVLQTLCDQGYRIAMEREAWNLRVDDGQLAASEALMLRAAEDNGPDGNRAAGIAGFWMWEDRKDHGAELLLLRGIGHYEEARTALAELFQATARECEAERLLQAGYALLEIVSMIPYADLLEERGEFARAEEVLRRGSELGDSHSSWKRRLTAGTPWPWKCSRRTTHERAIPGKV